MERYHALPVSKKQVLSMPQVLVAMVFLGENTCFFFGNFLEKLKYY